MKRRSRWIGFAAAAALAGGAVGAVSAVQAQSETMEYLEWHVGHKKHDRYFQEFESGTAVSERQYYKPSWSEWKLFDSPELVTVSAENGVPVFIAKTGKHGVGRQDVWHRWLEGSKHGGSLDTISGDEALVIRRGADLEQDFSGLSNLRLAAARSGATVVITPLDGETELTPIELEPIGSKKTVEVDVPFDVFADGIKFSAAAGEFSILGFTGDDSDHARIDLETPQIVSEGNPVVSELGDDDAVTNCASGTEKCSAGITIEQRLFVDDDGVVNLDVIPLGDVGSTDILTTVLSRKHPSDQLPDTLEVDYDVDGNDFDFVPVTPCSALPGGVPGNDPENFDTIPPVCQVQSIVTSGEAGAPILEEVTLLIAADPRMR